METIFRELESILASFWDNLDDWLGDHGWNIAFIILLAFFLHYFGARILGAILAKTSRHGYFPTERDREKRVDTINSLVSSVLKGGVYILAIILIVAELFPQYTGAFFASAGVLGVALGFGAQSIVKDFLSGFFVISENQFRVGDVVELDQKLTGAVQEISLRSTILRDLDGNVHHVPNGTFNIATNMTMGYGRINEDVLVGYDTDIDKLKDIVNKVGEAMLEDEELREKLIEAPYFARVKELANDGILVKILAKTDPSSQWAVKGVLLERLKVAFEKNNIDIPYPQLVIHQKS